MRRSIRSLGAPPRGPDGDCGRRPRAAVVGRGNRAGSGWGGPSWRQRLPRRDPRGGAHGFDGRVPVRDRPPRLRDPRPPPRGLRRGAALGRAPADRSAGDRTDRDRDRRRDPGPRGRLHGGRRAGLHADQPRRRDDAGAQASVPLAIKALPGVQNVDDGSGLFVRGGDSQETRFFLNEAGVLDAIRPEEPTGSSAPQIDPFLSTGSSSRAERSARGTATRSRRSWISRRAAGRSASSPRSARTWRASRARSKGRSASARAAR